MMRAVSVSADIAACDDCRVSRQWRKEGGISSVTVTFCDAHSDEVV